MLIRTTLSSPSIDCCHAFNGGVEQRKPIKRVISECTCEAWQTTVRVLHECTMCPTGECWATATSECRTSGKSAHCPAPSPPYQSVVECTMNHRPASMKGLPLYVCLLLIVLCLESAHCLAGDTHRRPVGWRTASTESRTAEARRMRMICECLFYITELWCCLYLSELH